MELDEVMTLLLFFPHPLFKTKNLKHGVSQTLLEHIALEAFQGKPEE